MQHKPLSKKYYTISEVAQRLRITPSLLRFWEKKFPSLNPQKSVRGVRRYTDADITLLQRIYQLVKEKGYTLAGARAVLDGGTQRHKAMIKNLREIRSFLVHLQAEANASARSSTG